MNNLRPDMVENQRLDKIFNWDDWVYEDFLWMFHDFINDELLRDNWLKKFNFPSEVIVKINECKNAVYEYLKKKITEEDLGKVNYSIIKSLDFYEDTTKEFLKGILMGTGTKGRNGFEDYDVGFVIGHIVCYFYFSGDEELFKKFGDFVENYPKMQKYKIQLSN